MQNWHDYPKLRMGRENLEEHLKSVTEEFLALNKFEGRTIHVRYTNATNTEAFRVEMQTIEDILLKEKSYQLSPCSPMPISKWRW